jgi:phenylpropionate dioxygenase-like ring-hydroxylating dioxygenase large terminal subunit
MDAETERCIIRRTLDHLSAHTTDFGSTEAYAPVETYLSRGALELEQERVFRELPIPILPSSRLARPGDFVTRDDHGVPILATRDREGRARAFLNACQHRGTKLVWENEGADRHAFVCPYHAWSYADDGRLMHIRHASGFPGIHLAERSLAALDVWERGGLFWLKLARSTPSDLDAWLSPIARELDALGLDTHVPFRPHSKVWRANWKILVDGALETYHFRQVHAKTIYGGFYDNLLVFDKLGDHIRGVLPKRSIATLRDVPETDWSLRPHAHIVYFLFPCTALLVQPDHVAVLSMRPQGVAETVVETTMLVPETPRTDKAIAHWEKNLEITLRTLDEDFALGEKVHEGLTSGALERVTFGRNELGIAAFHETLDRMLGRDRS